MDEPTTKVSPTLRRSFNHLHAYMLLDEIEESILGLAAELREFRFRIGQPGLLDRGHLADYSVWFIPRRDALLAARKRRGLVV